MPIRELVNRHITVTKNFIEWRDRQKWEPQNCMGHDYLLLECYLIKKGLAEKPYASQHDIIFNDMRIDIKEIQNYFNIQNAKDKIKWWEQAIDEGDLTHFLFVRSDRDTTRGLREGDIITFSYIGLWEASEIIKMLSPSKKVGGGAYISTLELEALWN